MLFSMARLYERAQTAEWNALDKSFGRRALSKTVGTVILAWNSIRQTESKQSPELSKTNYAPRVSGRTTARASGCSFLCLITPLCS